jgi:hypothetical protein
MITAVQYYGSLEEKLNSNQSFLYQFNTLSFAPYFFFAGLPKNLSGGGDGGCTQAVTCLAQCFGKILGPGKYNFDLRKRGSTKFLQGTDQRLEDPRIMRVKYLRELEPLLCLRQGN